MIFTPDETDHVKLSTYGAAIAIVCAVLLMVELSRPSSRIGWFVRGVSDEIKISRMHNVRFWRSKMLVITETDIDVMTRTIIGEAAREPDIGKIAVAHVIINRAVKNVAWYGGNNLADVSLHKASAIRSNGRRVTVWQFEPWMSRRDYLWTISKHSALYQHTRRLVIGCVNGTYSDPTEGATHFLEPNIVRSRTGGTLPKWASGNGRKIGRHVFFKPVGRSI